MERKGPDLDNPDEYWDLASRVSAVDDTYSDFEGFVDPQRIVGLLHNDYVIERLDGWSPEAYPRDFARDMLLHFAYENLAQTGHEVTSEEACAFLDTLAWLLQARYWMRVKDSELIVDEKKAVDG